MKEFVIEDTKTEFNSSIATLVAIRDLLNDCHDYSRLATLNGYNLKALKMWRNSIRRLYIEIRPKIKDEDRLIWVKPTQGDNHVQLITANGQAIRFNEKDVRDM